MIGTCDYDKWWAEPPDGGPEDYYWSYYCDRYYRTIVKMGGYYENE